MGICDSKEEKEAKKFINDLKAVKDPRYISYDSNGNLVYGNLFLFHYFPYLSF